MYKNSNDRCLSSVINDLEGLDCGKEIQKIIREVKVSNDRDYLVMKLLGIPTENLESIYTERGLDIPDVSYSDIVSKNLRGGLLKNIVEASGINDCADSHELLLSKQDLKYKSGFEQSRIDTPWNKHSEVKFHGNDSVEDGCRDYFESVNPYLMSKVDDLLNMNRDKDCLTLVFLFKCDCFDGNGIFKNMGLGWDIFENILTENSEIINQYSLLVALQLLESNKASSATCKNLIENTFLSDKFNVLDSKGVFNKIKKLIAKIDEILSKYENKKNVFASDVINEICNLHNVNLILGANVSRNGESDDVYLITLKNRISRIVNELIHGVVDDHELMDDREARQALLKTSKSTGFEIYLKRLVEDSETFYPIYFHEDQLIRAKLTEGPTNQHLYKKKEVLDRDSDLVNIHSGLCTVMSQHPGILCKIQLPIEHSEFDGKSNTWLFGPKEWVEVIENSPASIHERGGSIARRESENIANDPISTEPVFIVNTM